MTNNTISYRMSTPQEMVLAFHEELSVTPKWKWLRRMQLKRNIEFWGKL